MRLLWEVIEKAAVACLSLLFRIIRKELTEEMVTAFMQFVKFGVVGASSSIISYVLYAVSLLIIQKMEMFTSVDYLVAQGIAFMVSVLWTFYWNNKMVLALQDGKKRSAWKSLIKTYISYSFTGLFLNGILLVLWVQVCHISEFIAPIINLIIGVPLNFLINKFWSFRSDS